MRKCLSIILLIFVPVLCFSQYLEKTPSGGLVDWTDQLIREVGIGAPNPNLPVGAQRASAIEAAKRVALRNLLERVQGMNITSEVTVQDYMVVSDVIYNRVEGAVRNFRVIDTRYKSDGSVEVEVEVPLSGIFGSVLPDYIPLGAQAPGYGGEPTSAVYTGLIVDSRGLGLRPALAPKIVDQNGMEVYGTGSVSRDYALQIGVVGYEKDLNRARANERVTNNPLVVKAVEVTGTHNTDIVISNQEANMIRASAQNLNYLQQCKVMLILD
ncbi:MAG: LPP20 family lipoprotein [bacterium]|nr:MAG: LPP20 family lipoprotein [bacterium]